MLSLLLSCQACHAKYVGAVTYAPPGLLADMPNGAIVSGQRTTKTRTAGWRSGSGSGSSAGVQRSMLSLWCLLHME